MACFSWQGDNYNKAKPNIFTCVYHLAEVPTLGFMAWSIEEGAVVSYGMEGESITLDCIYSVPIPDDMTVEIYYQSKDQSYQCERPSGNYEI